MVYLEVNIRATSTLQKNCFLLNGVAIKRTCDERGSAIFRGASFFCSEADGSISEFHGFKLDKYNHITIMVVMRKQYLDILPSHWLNTAEVLHALGDVTRQRILLLFEPGEELSIKAIADLFPFSRTNTAHHIAVLEKAGILTRQKRGRDVFLKLDKNVVIDALENVLTYAKTEA